MSIANILPKHLRPRREKVFGLAVVFPHDRNACVRIEAFVLAWNARHKQEGQSTRGRSPPPISGSCTRFCGIFTSYKDGLCFPSYETIAEKARCCRDAASALMRCKIIPTYSC